LPTNPGLYDLIVTEALADSLRGVADHRRQELPLGPEEAASRLADALGVQLERLLGELSEEEGEATRKQLDLVNGLLAHLRGLGGSDPAIDLLSEPARVLRAIHPVGVDALLAPETGLAAPWLFTAGRGSPSLLTELRRESAACDQVDILVSFITLSGVRKLIDVLQTATAANAEGIGRTRIRVLTTTYTGATELEALDVLARLNGCEIKISLDGRRTRLHAKAWIFKRDTGFGSAYVGSANLSGAALMGGLEWTVKFTQRGQSALFDRAQAHFDTLWLDPEFTRFDSDNPDCRAAVKDALRREGGEGELGALSFFDIVPKPYQQDMLDQLEHERAAGRNRSLLVAATGTGKTVIAALDYRNTCAKLGHRPRLLFVAHRAQILRQALRTYREALKDNSFGELLTGGLKPTQHEYLFASIDSLASRDLVDQFGPGYWHTVAIDECHRMAADRLDRLATQIQPRILLGLTATPERTDGQSILKYFSPRPDNAPAVELRLWDALDMQLLAPFEYYACDDDTDFSEVPWNRVGETAAIEQLVTGNDVRARLVINEWRRLAGDPRRRRAIVFCVSVAHAEFMTKKFNEAGLPSLCITGNTPRMEQLRAPRLLSDGTVCALVTVDLYNEGVDLPDVDTLLLLRPTESPVLFQQQIGRGLRLAPGKESCLVLDFVGQHRADFRFDKLLAVMTGLTRRELITAVEEGFGMLPPGCHIQLQRQTREQVLHSLRALVNQSWSRLTSELRSYATIRGSKDVSLASFVSEQRLNIGEIYRSAAPSGWTTLKRAAELLPGEAPEGEENLSRRFGDLLHADDPAYLGLVQRLAAEPGTFKPASEFDSRRAQMLTYQVDSSRQAMNWSDMTQRLTSLPECAAELQELAALRSTQSRLDPLPIPGLEDVPLALHGAYRIREILTAVGFLTAERRTPFQAGVLPLAARKCELLFVTLDKSDGYHDRIAYHDYALSPDLFHWQTQNAAGPDTTAGKRYINSGQDGWTFQLFVRTRKDQPYRACGPVVLAGPDAISGDRPMNITWALAVPLPPKLFAEYSVLRSQA
jgi:superfamily II DNA or RNA helicase/HKD family nuclease